MKTYLYYSMRVSSARRNKIARHLLIIAASVLLVVFLRLGFLVLQAVTTDHLCPGSQDSLETKICWDLFWYSITGEYQ